MKYFFLILFLYRLAQAHFDKLEGEWRYTGFEYRRQFFQPLDPDLDLRFNFGEDRTMTLTYSSPNEKCESRSLYEISETNMLHLNVIWINPENRGLCLSDPDMQLGHESITEFDMADEKLTLHLEMGGEPLLYFLNKINRP